MTLRTDNEKVLGQQRSIKSLTLERDRRTSPTFKMMIKTPGLK